MTNTLSATEITAKISQEISFGNKDSLKELVRKGIESYQGSPAKNENKLNESVAHSLDKPNFDTLNAELSQLTKRKRSKYKVEIKGTDEFESSQLDDIVGRGFVFINDQLIDPEIIANETAGFEVIDRYDHIEDLVRYTAEPLDNDNYDHSVTIRKKMMRDIIMLEDNPDMTHCDFIIKDDFSTGYCTYASEYHNIEMYDLACERILEENEDFAKTPRCPCCLSDLTQDDSVDREYFNKHDDETLILTGKYDGKERHFESRGSLCGSGWEYSDDSDTCSNCNEYL